MSEWVLMASWSHMQEERKEQESALTSARDYFFEGAEKRLEIDFLETANSYKKGMLAVSRAQWEILLASVNCLILSSTICEDCHSFVLSESSLFVFPLKVLIKTCGNTTLLECLDLLLKYSLEANLKVDYVTYSHRSFVRPHLQQRAYRSFESEVSYVQTVSAFPHLNQIEELNRHFDGNGFTLGPLNGERWFIYVADLTQCPSNKEEVEQTIEIMMSCLDRKIMAQFYKGETNSNVSDTSGIAALIPGSLIDDHVFEPCGYSMNGLKGRYYSTVHITPQPEFSYVSFESNLPMSSYDDLIRRVLNTFKPGCCIISVFADSEAPCGDANKSYDALFPGYSRTFANTCEFVGRRSVTCSHYVSSARSTQKHPS